MKGWPDIARKRLAMVTAALAFATLSAPAYALDADVASDTSAQFYDVRAPTGQTVLFRRRVTTTLGIAGFNLLETRPRDPKAPQLVLRMRLRYDADHAGGGAADPNSPNNVAPGYSPDTVDLMVGYVEGRRFFAGWLGFKIGRQYVTDVLGWWSFDGGEVSVAPPFFLKAEVYAGLEQRGGLPFSASRYEADGVWRGDRSNYPTALYPAFQAQALAPAVGAALESTGVTWIHGRLTYRRVQNTGTSNVGEFKTGLGAPSVYDRTRIASERVGYAFDLNLPHLGGAKGGIVYDLYRNGVTSAYGSLDAYVGQKTTLSADYDFYVPSFDADSIWNFFAGEPRSDFGLRANVDVASRLSLSGNAHLRVMTVQTAPYDPGVGTAYAPSTNYAPLGHGSAGAAYYPSNGHPFDEGGGLSLRFSQGETRVGVHARGDFGDEGDRVGGDAFGEHVFETRYVLSGRAGVWQWKDRLRAERATASLGYVAGVGYRFARGSQGSVEWEHDVNGLVGQRFRLLFLLSLGLTR